MESEWRQVPSSGGGDRLVQGISGRQRGHGRQLRYKWGRGRESGDSGSSLENGTGSPPARQENTAEQLGASPEPCLSRWVGDMTDQASLW